MTTNPLLRSTWIILRNDLRLLWRELLGGKLGAVLSASLVGAIFILFNIIGIAIFLVFRRPPPLGVETMVWLFFAFLMLGTAMNQAIAVLFVRADFDLLLSSPVPSSSILLARMAAMIVGAASAAALFLLPMLNGAILAVSPRYLAGYVVWLLLACLVGSAAVWGTLLLVRWLGPQRARTWAQVVAAILGGSIYLVFQGQNMLPMKMRAQAVAWTTEAFDRSGLNTLGRAGHGDPLALLFVAFVALVGVAATTRLLSRLFITGIQDAGAVVGRRRRASGRYRIRAGVLPATFLKDVRLIVRDPLLLAQLLPSVVYVVPALFGVSRFGGALVLGPAALLIASQFSLLLAAVAASGEECWDLILMSPTAERQLRLGKLAAALALPVGLATLISVVLAVLGHPWVALLTFAYSVGCGAAAGWLQVTRVKPTPRRDLIRRRRANGDFVRGLISMTIMFLAGGGLVCAGSGHWAIATFLLVISALAIGACFALVDIEEIRSWPTVDSGSPAPGG